MDLVVARRGEVAEVAAVVDGVVGQRWDVPWDEFPGWVAERLPAAPLTRSQVALMRKDNVADQALPGLTDIGVAPTDIIAAS